MIFLSFGNQIYYFHNINIRMWKWWFIWNKIKTNHILCECLLSFGRDHVGILYMCQLFTNLKNYVGFN